VAFAHAALLLDSADAWHMIEVKYFIPHSRVLNVAGLRASKEPHIGSFGNAVLTSTFHTMSDSPP
jgi:hypothetical protein